VNGRRGGRRVGVLGTDPPGRRAARATDACFAEYRAVIDGISDRVIAQRLREREVEQLIERTVR
jgi:hypothetical protein